MYNAATKNQFIELRAEGLSLDAISSRLNIPRCTLGRWHHESIEQIQRLRSLQWHLLEEQIGHRLEDSLQRIAQRIRKCEDELDTRDPHYRKAVELVRIIRDSRREYLQLRALLLAPLQPTRGRAACLTSIDQPKRDKTRQTPDALDTTSQPTNDLQQPQLAVSHSATCEGPAFAGANSLINTPLQRGEPAQPPIAPTASAVDPQSSEIIHPNPPPVGVPPSGGPSTSVPQRAAESPDTIPANDASPALPLPAGEGRGEGQAGSIISGSGDQSQIQNRKSKIDPSSSTSPPLCGEPLDTPPLINTPLQRGEPAQRVSDTTASAVDSQSSDTIRPIPAPVGVPPSGGPSTSVPQRAAESPDTIPANDASPALPLPAGEGQTGNLPPSVPKKHKPYWLYGHYYQNPEYPEHIARALCARRGHSSLNSQPK